MKIEKIIELLKLIPSKFDGYKSVIGAIGIITGLIAMAYGISLPVWYFEIFGTLLGIGAVHKIKKNQDTINNLKTNFDTLVNTIDNIKTGVTDLNTNVKDVVKNVKLPKNKKNKGING